MNIYMRVEKLSLKHGNILIPKIDELACNLSEYCFSNLYLFRKVHECKVILNDRIFISGNTYDGFSYLMPLFDVGTVSTEYLVEAISGYDFFSRSVKKP